MVRREKVKNKNSLRVFLLEALVVYLYTFAFWLSSMASSAGAGGLAATRILSKAGQGGSLPADHDEVVSVLLRCLAFA